MNIEIPKFLEHLKKDARGYPIPFFVAYPNGTPDFRMMDGKKFNYCITQNLCFVCGKKHIKGFYYFITGPLGLQNRVHSDCPSHKECAEYSLKTCPHLLYERAARNERGAYYQEAAAKNMASVKNKPDEIFLIYADSYTSIQGTHQGHILLSFRVKGFTKYSYKNGLLQKE